MTARRWFGMRGWWGAAMLCLVILVAGCGLPGHTSAPDTLAVTVSTAGAPGGPADQTRHFSVSDASKVQPLYDHIQGLKAIPPTTEVPCLPATRHYQLDFQRGGPNVFSVTVGPCRNLMRTTGNITHATDATFWQLLDDAVGQTIS